MRYGLFDSADPGGKLVSHAQWQSWKHRQPELDAVLGHVGPLEVPGSFERSGSMISLDDDIEFSVNDLNDEEHDAISYFDTL